MDNFHFHPDQSLTDEVSRQAKKALICGHQHMTPTAESVCLVTRHSSQVESYSNGPRLQVQFNLVLISYSFFFFFMEQGIELLHNTGNGMEKCFPTLAILLFQFHF